MPVWPDSLPQEFHVQGFSADIPNGAVRQDMDAGPAFQRRRFTAAPQRFSGRVWVSRDQYQTLKGFYTDTIAMGALSFDWKHPITEEAATVQIDASEGLSLSAVSGVLFAVEMTIEVLP